MNVDNIFQIAYIAAITVLAVVSSKTAENTPYPVDVCLVASGPEGEDRSTNIWSDQIEQYFEKYPGSYCGACGEERKCPEK